MTSTTRKSGAPDSASPVENAAGPGIDKFASRLIRRKAREVVRCAGFNPSEREDVEQELTLVLLRRLGQFNHRVAHYNAFVTTVVDRSGVRFGGRSAQRTLCGFGGGDAMAIDTQGVLRTLQQDNQQNNRGLEQGLQQRNDARGQALLDQQKAAEAELEQLRQQRRDKLDQAQTAAEAAGPVDWAAQTAAAQADLQKSLDAAAALPKLLDTNLANDTLQPAAENTSDLAMADTSKGFSSQGTFSAAAVWGLSAGGVNERAAKAAESTAANTRQLVDHARRGRLVFG